MHLPECREQAAVNKREAALKLVMWSPASMSLTNLFSTDTDRALHETVLDAPDGQEVLDEVCRMVIDELERLSAQPPG